MLMETSRSTHSLPEKHGPVTSPASRDAPLDAECVRQDFPIFARPVHGRRLVYLDSAATTQKPQTVIDAITDFYTTSNSNIHRGVHTLSMEATDAYEQARADVQRWIGARGAREIVFVRGATEAINLVAHSYGRRHVGPGDEILVSAMEHHANIVPWQLLCQETGARLRVIPMDECGQLRVDEIESLIGPRTRLLAVAHVSNALGTVNPVDAIVQIAHRHGVPVLVDGAQAIPHLAVDVATLDCEFYVFSGHKVYGPTGVGVLYGKADWLHRMAPYQGGGDMIRSVTWEHTTFNEIPYRFEAGTPHIAGAIGLAAALRYLQGLGLARVKRHERDLLQYATEALASIPGLRLVGTAAHKASVLSFVVAGVHPHDLGTILDREGIAIRTGHHCAQPVMDRLGIPATARASLGVYNTRADIDALVCGIHHALRIFA